jgi:hypothetical protein
MTAAALPRWIRPQLVDAAPEGEQWLHEIKYDGYACMRASIMAPCVRTHPAVAIGKFCSDILPDTRSIPV